MPFVTTDTISDIGIWPIWERILVALLGLFAIATCSDPLSHEIRNALEKDLRWKKIVSRLIVTVLPLAAVLAGFNNFLLIVGLSGGLFIGMQYVLIVAVARRALTFSTVQKFWLDAIAIVFIAAAVYELVKFL